MINKNKLLIEHCNKLLELFERYDSVADYDRKSELLEKHCSKLIKLFEKYDSCMEFEEKIGVKCDVTELTEQIEIEVAIINSLL